MITVGIDPGQVHSAAVRVLFDTYSQKIYRKFAVFNGLDTHGLHGWAAEQTFKYGQIFIEKYRPRHNYGGDKEMIQAEGELKRLMPNAVLLENTGVLKTCPAGLMELMGLYHWPQSTHHQDIRSAARIMLKGVIKDPTGNTIVADIVRAHLNGSDWEVVDA